jgi:hypothetical protein
MQDIWRWVSAGILWTIAWTLMLAASFNPKHSFPFAAWGVFVAVIAAVDVGWIMIDYVSRRERLRVEKLTGMISQGMAEENHGITRI